MNIPRETSPALLTFDNGDLTAQQIAVNLVTDMAVSAAYVLVLFIIVYLNRKKYISIYVPQRTYLITFAAVFLINFAATMAALMLPGVAVTLGYKIAIALLMFAIVAAVWRVLPRDIDVHERHRLRLENVEMQQAIADRNIERFDLLHEEAENR